VIDFSPRSEAVANRGLTVQRIHPTAIVEDGAVLANDVVVEAYARIGSEARLGPRCIVRHGAIIERGTIGSNNEFFPYCVVGGIPQDKKYKGENTALVIGSNNVIREHVTISIGTEGGGGVTRIGDRNLLMASSHIGHDCQIGNDCIIATFAGLAGHCHLEDFSILAGQAGLHQFVRVGTGAFVGGGSKVGKDVPPFTFAQGYPASLRGINTTGLQRRNFAKDTIHTIKRAYRMIFYTEEKTEVAMTKVREELGQVKEVQTFLKFLEASQGGRDFLRPLRGLKEDEEPTVE
jgi:UDP-N-acetylglucosamine acyltransferase